MPKTQRWVLFLLVMMTCAPLTFGQEFYETQLRLGADAYRAKRFIEAADQLRIASFGLLDRPKLLAETLARLAVAQNAAGRKDAIDNTLSRFVEVEQRFAGSYDPARLDAEVRRDFEQLIRAKVPAATLATLRPFAKVRADASAELADLSPAERRKRLIALAKKEPNDITWPLALAREALTRRDSKEMIRWSRQALSIDAENGEAHALKAQGHVMRKEFRDASAEFDRVPEQLFEGAPQLYADKFVALMNSNRFADARLVVELVPADLRARSDVARALRLYRDAEAKLQRESLEVEPSSEAASAAEVEPGTSGRLQPVRLVRAADARRPSAGSFTNRPVDPHENTLAQSRALLEEGKASEAEKLLHTALKTSPDRRDLRLALLEAAAIARDWRTASAQISLLEPLRAGEEASMFYAAVVLYELGRGSEARPYLERALPNLVASASVDAYSRRILGQ